MRSRTMFNKWHYVILFFGWLLVTYGFLAIKGCVSTSEAGQEDPIATLRKEITTEFQQVKHLIGANTSQQIVYLKIMYLKPDVDVDVAKKIATSVFKHSRAMKKNPDLLLAIIQVESQFRPEVVSQMGAEGTMQIMPVWKKTVCNGYNLREIDDNIKCGAQVYSLYEEQYKDMKLALTVYNRGPSYVDLTLSKNQNPSNGYAEKVLAIYNRLQAIGEIGSEEI